MKYVFSLFFAILIAQRVARHETQAFMNSMGHRPIITRTCPTLAAYSSRSSSSSKNRDKILQRKGGHFELNRFSGRVEFGSTVNLITNLENADMATVSDWISDERRVALSIWDEKLIEDRGNNIYRLQLMTLQFVTIQLSPRVDNRMWTEVDQSGVPIFKLQSIDFDPNIQVLPGMNIPASALGIDIEVVGELRPSRDGKGVEGKIGFVSSGNLTPPLRLLPEPALKTASDVICKTISDFAIQSFQKGARLKYREFQMRSVGEKK
jgi:ABC-type uncharacterized transport system, permease component